MGSGMLSNHVHFRSNQFSNHNSVLKTQISFQIIKSVLKTQISPQICQIRFSNHKAVYKSLNTANIKILFSTVMTTLAAKISLKDA